MEGILGDITVWLTEIGPWAYVVAPVVMALVAVLPVPAEAPAMANGMLFGWVLGSAITWTGAFAGAWISFEIARAYGRPLVARVVAAEALERVDAVADKAGWWGLILLRLVPVVAFTALNWGLGMCRVPRSRFLWTTAVGILPGAIVFTTSGAGLAALYRRSPPLAAAVTMAVLGGMMLWMYHRRGRPAVG